MGINIKFFLLLACITLASCTGDNSSSDTINQQSYNIEGISAKGPIAEATINIYLIETNGSRGELVAGPYTTDANGNWNTDDELPSGGPFEVVSSGGYYIDEATDTEVILDDDDELSGIIVSSDTDINVAITPLTHAALITARHSIANFGMNPSDAVRHAIGDMQSSLGFDVTTTLPPATDDITSTTNSQKLYTAILGGISELSASTDITNTLSQVSKFDIAIALAQDLSDGKLDGNDINGEQITVDVDDIATNLPPLDPNGITPLNEATNTFADSIEGLETTSINNNTELTMGCHGTQALNDSLKFGIDGGGFFSIELNGEELVTRYGSHCLSSDGKIKSTNGGFLQGFPIHPETGNSTSNTPSIIQLFSDPYTIDDLASIDINADGDITVDYLDSNSIVVARISVITFPSHIHLGELDNLFCFETYSSGRGIAKEPGHAGSGIIDKSIKDFSAYTSCYGEPSEDKIISFTGDSYLRFTNSEDGRVMYTQDTIFMMDKDGYIIYGSQPKNIVYQDGQWINDIETWYLNGYATDSNGNLTSNTTSYMQISTGVSNPVPTTSIYLNANIDANEDAIPDVTIFDPNDSNSFNHSTSITIYDSLGISHQLTAYFRKVPDALGPPAIENQWQTYTYVDSAILPPKNFTGVAPNTQLYITLQFDNEGILQSISDNDNAYTGGSPATLAILFYGALPMPAAEDLNIEIDYVDLTQYSSSFAVNSILQDGFSTGQFIDLNINSSGELLASFSSGQTTVLGQIAAANFENPDLLVAGELGFYDPGETAIITTVSEAGDELISTL